MPAANKMFCDRKSQWGEFSCSFNLDRFSRIRTQHLVSAKPSVRGTGVVEAGEDLDEVVAAVLLVLQLERHETQMDVFAFEEGLKNNLSQYIQWNFTQTCLALSQMDVFTFKNGFLKIIILYFFAF